MQQDIFMPQLGMTMSEGKVSQWLKKVGDPIEKGEVIFLVETDKAIQEVPALEGGILTQILVQEDLMVPVGTILGYIQSLDHNDAVAAQSLDAIRAAPVTANPVESASIISPVPTASASALRLGQTQNNPADEVRASPIAKRMAHELGIDLRTVRGSGPGGRILEVDIRRAMEAGLAQVSSPAAAMPMAATSAVQVQEVRGVRKITADRMTASFSTTPHFYLTVEANAKPLTALYQQLRLRIEKKHSVALTLTDLFIKITGLALRENPLANASWSDGSVKMYSDVNLGVAVGTEEGLFVPVVREPDRMPLWEIAQVRGRLTDKARAGKLALEEMEGATCTLSNLGMYGIDFFQAIINPPQSCILAFGRVKERPCVDNAQVVVGLTIFVTFSCDHRVLDGVSASKFLACVVDLIEQPSQILLAD